MTIDVAKRIINYVIDQAQVFDGKNIDIEQDIIHKILKEYDKMGDRIMDTVHIHGDIDSVLKYQNLVNRIEAIVEQFYSEAYKILIPAVGSYMEKGYTDNDQLIEIGLEMEGKLQEQKITELASDKRIGKIPDPNAVEFMKKHAYEQVTNVSNTIINQMRADLGKLLAAKIYDKKAVADSVEKILTVNRKRTETIAQQELSMAYNNGALMRYSEYNSMNSVKMQKYWHGFKYSEVTCTYCRPRIGTVYDIDDDSEVLPAHVKCRCIWLPYRQGWLHPITGDITRNANMLKRVYDADAIYKRINTRLGINYGSYLKVEDAVAYMSGDRTPSMVDKLDHARDLAVKDQMKAFDIAQADSQEKLGLEFNAQMRFWKKFVAEGIVDVDKELLSRSYRAIQGVMILPWTGKQLTEWDKLLKSIEDKF